MRHHFEVVVIGGGPAGATAGLALARAGRRVLIVESNGQEAFKIGESVPPVVSRLLGDLGLGAPFAADGHIPCWGNRSVWGSSAVASTDFIADANGCGWHLDRAKFDATLRRVAHEAGSELWTPAKVVKVTRNGAEWDLCVQRRGVDHRASCDWVLDCTGRSSSFARRQGVQRADDDVLIASIVVCRPRPETPPDEDCLTLIESVADGWWYTARLPDGNRVVSYFTDADLPGARVSRTPGGYAALLEATQQVRSRLAGYSMDAPPVTTRANSARLQRLAGENWLAAGDAATSFDPLSSQGIFHALYSGMRAAQAVDRHLRGDPGAIESYITRIEHVYDCYLQNRNAFYESECRWNSDFWRRRRARHGAGSHARRAAAAGA